MLQGTVAGLREYFSQTDERAIAPRMPLMVNMASASDPSKKSKRFQSSSFRFPNSSNRMMDEYSDDDGDFQCAGEEVGLYLLYDALTELMIEFYDLHINRFLRLRLRTKEMVGNILVIHTII